MQSLKTKPILEGIPKDPDAIQGLWGIRSPTPKHSIELGAAETKRQGRGSLSEPRTSREQSQSNPKGTGRALRKQHVGKERRCFNSS